MRFIHTADWQLGLKLRYLNPERAAQLRLLRFQTVRAIGRLAQERQVDAVLVAGDVLDDNALGRDSLQQASDALQAFGKIPVGLLPGNHDAASADSALARLDLPENVRLLFDRTALAFGESLVYPCPLARRHEMDDPTEWLPERETGEPIRIAVAHGGVIDFSNSADSETPNLINAKRVIEKGFDYLALGDWHSTFQFGPRVWYPGAHEATRFKEVDPGAVLIVEIDEPGALPRVERVSVAQTHWLTLTLELSDDTQIDELRTRLEGLNERSQTLVKLVVSGNLSLGASDVLEHLITEYSERLAYLRCDLSGLKVEPDESDLASLRAEGFMAQALEALRSGDDPADTDAIRLMYRLQQDAAHASD